MKLCKFVSKLVDWSDVSSWTNDVCGCKRENIDQTKIKQRSSKEQTKIKRRSNKVEQMVCVDARENKDQISHSSAWAVILSYERPPIVSQSHQLLYPPTNLGCTMHINRGGVMFTAPWFGFNNILGEISSGFESVPGPISLELLSPDCQLHRRMDVPTPVKIDRLFSKHPNPDQFSVVQRGIPSSVWSQPVNQGLIGSFQPLVRPWLSPRWVGREARKRSKTSVFFSSALLIIDYRLGSRIHFASQQ